jgi:hypothetical protein
MNEERKMRRMGWNPDDRDFEDEGHELTEAWRQRA